MVPIFSTVNYDHSCTSSQSVRCFVFIRYYRKHVFASGVRSPIYPDVSQNARKGKGS